MIRMRSLEDRTCTVMEQGHHYVDIALNEIVIFVKKDHVLPIAVLGEDVRTVADVEDVNCEWIGYVDSTTEYVWYNDDGETKEYTPQGAWKTLTF